LERGARSIDQLAITHIIALQDVLLYAKGEQKVPLFFVERKRIKGKAKSCGSQQPSATPSGDSARLDGIVRCSAEPGGWGIVPEHCPAK
jgi:hypothetical protein